MTTCEEYTLCKPEELQFAELTEDDKKVLETHLKRGAFHWILGFAMIAFGIGFLVWAWLLSDNGIGYDIAVTILSLIVFAIAWTMCLRTPNTKATGAIHGRIESYRYEASKTDDVRAAYYYANITFDSSKQKLSDVQVPEGFKDNKEKTHRENHLPQKGTEIIIYKYDSKCTFVYPEGSKHTEKMYIKY